MLRAHAAVDECGGVGVAELVGVNVSRSGVRAASVEVASWIRPVPMRRPLMTHMNSTGRRVRGLRKRSAVSLDGGSIRRTRHEGGFVDWDACVRC